MVVSDRRDGFVQSKEVKLNSKVPIGRGIQRPPKTSTRTHSSKDLDRNVTRDDNSEELAERVKL